MARKSFGQKIYRIRIKEKLDSSWTNWFEGMELLFDGLEEEDASTHIIGPIADQAALNGMLNKVWNLNLTIISVEQIGE